MKTLAAALLLFTLSTRAQTKRPITFADLQALKRIADPQVSPSGKWVLFSVTDVSLEKNTKTNHLWSVPLTGGKEGQLTTGTGESNGRFSPDGKWVMYSSSEGGSGQIWIAPWNEADGSVGKGHAVTSLETEADAAIWAPDSQHVLFTSNVYPDCQSHAPLGPERNSEEAKCNAAKDAAAAKDPVKALVFDHLLYRHWTAFQGPKHAHIFYAGVDGAAPTDLTPASVIGDHEAPTFSLGGPLGYAVSPDGKEVAYVTNLDKVPAASTNNDIFTLQLGAEPSTAKKVSTSPGSDDGPAYSPDGKFLAWRSQARNGFESDQFKLVLFERHAETSFVFNMKLEKWQPPMIVRQGTTPPPSPPVQSGDLSDWIDEFSWSADSQRLFFTAPDEGQEVIYSVGANGQDLHRYGKFAGADTVGEWSGLVQLKPGNRWAGVLMRVDKPSEIAIANLAEMDDSSFINMAVVGKSHSQMQEWNLREGVPLGAPNYLTHQNDALLSQLALAKLEPFWFTGAANTKVEGFIIKPPNFDPNKKYPLKFLMHGGPQTAWGDSWSYRWNWELLAADGYVVIGINRRGSTGYGQKFVDEVSGDWGGKAYTDLMKGLDYAEATYPYIDKTRECALGASYGGFMANWVLTHTDRFKCIVTHDGMYNPESAFGSTEELWFNQWEFRPIANAPQKPGAPSSSTASSSTRVGSPNAHPGEVEQTKPAVPWDYFDKPAAENPFRKFSPMEHIKDAHTPTLVVHSQRDYRLDVSEGFQLFTALQLLNVPSKMLYFPDEGHWVLKPQNSQLWYQTVNDWCDRWTHTNKYASTTP